MDDRLAVFTPLLVVPLWKKAVSLLGVCVLMIVLYIYFGWMPLNKKIVQEQRNIKQQQRILKRNQKLAADLPRKKKEFARLEKQLKVALNMLPRASQIPDLLESVSRAGKDSGLEFTVFKPLTEAPKEFYAEVPVNLTLTGSYRQMLTFLKRVGEMPRIVDVKNLEIEKSAGNDSLQVKGLVVTYRFMEEGERKQKMKAGR